MLAGLLCAPAARAGHPMLTEDTGTQGAANYELELGYDWSLAQGSRSFLFQPQLSYGASPTLDLIIQPSWVHLHEAGGASEQGLGDSNLDFKWRFFGAAPLSLAVRAGAELPTAQNGLGLRPGRDGEHAILVASLDEAPWAIDLNAGLTHLSVGPAQRSDLYHYSGAVQYTLDAHWIVIVESSADANPDRARRGCLCVALAGLIYTVHPGLDLDAGYRGRLSAPAPAQQWLLGFTLRGAW